MSTNITKIFLVLNSGSSSEKFSLYEGEDEVCSLYFEGVEIDGKKKFICTVSKPDGSEEKVDKTWDSLDVAFKEAKGIFEKEGFINESHPLDGILVRNVAAGSYFSKHHIVTEETFEELKKMDLEYNNKKVTIEDLIEAVELFKTTKVRSKNMNNIIFYYGNPVVTVQVLFESIRNGNTANLCIENQCLAINKFIVELFVLFRVSLREWSAAVFLSAAASSVF